jgi:hypothetical protein
MVKFSSQTGLFAPLLTSVALLFVAACAGCKRQEISVYDVPKEIKSETQASTKPADHPQIAAPAAPADDRWKTAPSEWKSQAPGPMQDAKFLAADGKATITISVFEGSAGGVLANVNRWRVQQLQLPAVDEAGLSSLLTNLDSSEPEAKLVDMNGPKQRMVAAIVPRGPKTWFFKLLGDPATVAAEKERFVGFIKSTKE